MKCSWSLAIACMGAWMQPSLVCGGARQALTVGAVSVVVEPWRGGMRIAYGGVEIVKHSELVVTKPPWAPHFYLGPNEESVASAFRERMANAERLRIIHRGTHGSFEATETITVSADGRIEQVFHGQFHGPEDAALLQWRVGAMNPAVIVGRPYTARLSSGQTREGVVPVVARSSDVEVSTLAKGFTSLEIDSRVGPVRVEVESDRALILYDYRKARWATPEDPFFWFGDLGTRLKPGDAVHYRIIYQFPPAISRTEGSTRAQARADVTPRADAQTWSIEDPPTIIPRPKEAAFQNGSLTFPSGRVSNSPIRLTIASDDALTGAAARNAVIEFQRFLQRRFALNGAIEDSPAERVTGGVRFCPLPPGETLAAEGYKLQVEPGGAIIQAADAPGFKHGVQTLKQLASAGLDGTVSIRAATIRDWPSLSFRGVHLFTGGQGPALHEKLLRNVIGALKMNRVVIEAEYVKWDSHPEIHHAEYGMSKDDVRKVLAVCDELGIEVIPLVMSLGHCQWMFENDSNLELAEDPEAKWAYCVTNPKTYEFIFQIYDEAIELFKPKWFHIGHDEFADRGRVPHRRESMEYTVAQLFLTDTKRLHTWFTDRGVRVMMWGDMLLGEGDAPDACHAESPASAVALRDAIPDDVVIADWHYVDVPPEEYVSLDRFRDSGQATVAATWYRPVNIVNFARAAHMKKAMGLLQTTWAGYSLDPKRFEAELHQYATYVLAAEAAWNAENPPDPETYPTGSYFLDLMGLSTLTPANRKGWTADLSEAYNYSMAAGDADGWFGLGPEHDLSRVPGGESRFTGLRFRLGCPAGPSERSVVVLRGKLTRGGQFPAAVEIALSQKAHELVVLHATNFPCGTDTKVGQYELVYEDGATAHVDLIYGKNVLAYTDPSAAASAPIVWSARNAAGQPVALRVLLWENPNPDKTIRSFVAKSADAAGSLMLFGLTGLEGHGRSSSE